MKTQRAGWSTMVGFIVTLVVLLVGACTNSRSAWSFSADVPSPVLASITGGGEAGSTEESPVSTDTGKSGGTDVVNPAAPAPEATAAQPGATAPTGSAGSSGESTVRTGSRWPAIILGTVVVIGIILVVIYFLTRERDD